MKGFIKIDEYLAININHIIWFKNGWIFVTNEQFGLRTGLKYEEIKQLIINAQ